MISRLIYQNRSDGGRVDYIADISNEIIFLYPIVRLKNNEHDFFIFSCYS